MYFMPKKFTDSILIKCCNIDVIVFCVAMWSFRTLKTYTLPRVSTYPNIVDVSAINNKLVCVIFQLLVSKHGIIQIQQNMPGFFIREF